MTTELVVLLVEDNPGDARLLREQLRVGFRIVHVERLDDALRALQGSEAQPQVVLLDLSLPDSHGLDTCRRVCSAAPDVPVIVLTGTSDDRIAVAALREGAQDWLVKGQTDGDVVERAIRYAVERNRLSARLRELDRLRSLFVSVVSHDLRSPAASILAGMELLLSGGLGELTADQRRVVELARRTAHRQVRLVRDLLDVAVIEAGAMTVHPAEIPLDDLVEGVVEELRLIAADRGVRLRHERSSLMVRADPDRLAQALANVVSNAVKFATTEVVVRCAATGLDLTVTVDDDGPGIGLDVVGQLFDRFVRTEGPNSGAGLGLWIARGILQVHGGSIRGSNRPDCGGARFELVLPRAA